MCSSRAVAAWHVCSGAHIQQACELQRCHALAVVQEGARGLYVDEALPDIVGRHLLPAHATPVTINQERAAAVRAAYEGDAAFGPAGVRIAGMDQRCGALSKTGVACYQRSLSCMVEVSGNTVEQSVVAGQCKGLF